MASTTILCMNETARIGTVFQIMAQRMEVEQTALRMFIDGDRIEDECTPRSLGLKDGDVLDLCREQIG